MAKKTKRALTDNERRILHALLSKNFYGRDEILDQIRLGTASSVNDEDDCGSVYLFTDSSKKAALTHRIPVEGTTHDNDGAVVDVLLHVVDGVVNELEIVKYGSKKIKSQINPQDMVVKVNESKV